MAGKRFDFRFAVGSPNGPRSSVWAIWSRNSQVYAAHRSMGGIQKFSFHTPTLCLHAFTSEHGPPRGNNSRVIQKWHRGTTPANGHNQVVRVLRIGIATDHLSTKLAEGAPQYTNWIVPAPPGGTTVIDLLFTRDSEASLHEALANEPACLEHKVLAFRPLSDGEAIAVSVWHSEKSDKVFRLRAAPHDRRDLLIIPIDPDNTGRPLRLTLFSNPQDGDLMSVYEFGGYWHEPLTDAEWEAMCEPFKATDLEKGLDATG